MFNLHLIWEKRRTVYWLSDGLTSSCLIKRGRGRERKTSSERWAVRDTVRETERQFYLGLKISASGSFDLGLKTQREEARRRFCETEPQPEFDVKSWTLHLYCMDVRFGVHRTKLKGTNIPQSPWLQNSGKYPQRSKVINVFNCKIQNWTILNPIKKPHQP